MNIKHLRLRNWRNFRHVDIPLTDRQFIVGPNASGKSNLLDVFRFLRDIAKQEGGGLQKAMIDRGGMSKLRCLSARKDPAIVIDIELSDGDEEVPLWRYELGIAQEQRGHRQVLVAFERVWNNGKQILNRPDDQDKVDSERLKQTYLEQVNANKEFRDIPRFLAAITYLHIVPQLLRYPEIFQASVVEHDPFGQGFLERVAKLPEKSRNARLKVIEKALRMAVPQLKELGFERDASSGRPHLKALYSHWRPNAGWQREDQFSDGTLRLIGLLWSLLDGDSLLLLEEPELSLNAGITRHLSGLIHRMQRRRKRQVFITTHSETLLSDIGIDGAEIIMLEPDVEGTQARAASSIESVKQLLESGLPAGEVVIARTRSVESANWNCSMSSITLAVEDVLSERIALRMLAQLRGDLVVNLKIGFKGNAYLRNIARGLNKAAKGGGFILLTDQDNPASCPFTLISEWLGGDKRHPNLLFRVAVLEVEAWLLADRDAIAEFLGVPIARLPENADNIANPKQFLVNLARSSTRSNIRGDLVPKPGGTAQVGPNYNGRLAEFVEKVWSCKRAKDHSGSLKRAVRRIEDFQVNFNV